MRPLPRGQFGVYGGQERRRRDMGVYGYASIAPLDETASNRKKSP